MAITDFVTLTITKTTATAPRTGFGTPLLLSANASWTERVRFYTSLVGVAADFSSVTGPEYLSAQAVFSQSPRPKKMAIARSALKPTQVYVIGVANVKNSHAYNLKVKGDGVTSSTVTGTSDSSALNDEIIDALVTALNAVVGKNYTAVATGAGGSHVATVTATAAGNWFSLEVLDRTDLTCAQSHADPGVATDLDAIKLESNDWYALLTSYDSPAYVHAASAWTESNKKVYTADVPETAVVSSVPGGGDTVDANKTSGYTRTMAGFHPSPAARMSAAWMGRVLPKDPGSVIAAFKSLAGVDTVPLNPTERGHLTAKRGNSYEDAGGVDITFNGQMGSGDYFDTIRDLDWLEDAMNTGVFTALTQPDKVAYTDEDIVAIEAEVRATLDEAERRKIIRSGWSVSVPLVADVDDSDKAQRLLPDVNFTAQLASAVQSVAINGTVSL